MDGNLFNQQILLALSVPDAVLRTGDTEHLTLELQRQITNYYSKEQQNESISGSVHEL